VFTDNRVTTTPTATGPIIAAGHALADFPVALLARE
jgi:hypothetical protein